MDPSDVAYQLHHIRIGGNKGSKNANRDPAAADNPAFCLLLYVTDPIMSRQVTLVLTPKQAADPAAYTVLAARRAGFPNGMWHWYGWSSGR